MQLVAPEQQTIPISAQAFTEIPLHTRNKCSSRKQVFTGGICGEREAVESDSRKRQERDATGSCLLSVDRSTNTETSIFADSPLCKICMDSPVELAYIPFGHAVTCISCDNRKRRRLCLFCRAKIQNKLRVFY